MVKTIKKSIEQYEFKDLFDLNRTQILQDSLSDMLEIGAVIARNDETLITKPSRWEEFKSASEMLGEPIIIEAKCFGRLYIDKTSIESDRADQIASFVKSLVEHLAALGHKQYLYLEMLKEQNDKAGAKPAINEDNKYDIKTGLCSQEYFESRMCVVERAEVIPVALVAGNINGLIRINEKYGSEEGDRVVQAIAGIMQNEAKSFYIIGYYGDGGMYTIIPQGSVEEAKDYCKRVKEGCKSCFEDGEPMSIAFGIAVKENINTKLTDILSDAEYEMLRDKINTRK